MLEIIKNISWLIEAEVCNFPLMTGILPNLKTVEVTVGIPSLCDLAHAVIPCPSAGSAQVEPTDASCKDMSKCVFGAFEGKKNEVDVRAHATLECTSHTEPTQSLSQGNPVTPLSACGLQNGGVSFLSTSITKSDLGHRHGRWETNLCFS